MAGYSSYITLTKPLLVDLTEESKALAGSVKTISLEQIHQSKFMFNELPLQWNSYKTGSLASINYIKELSSVNLSVGIDSGEQIIRQTKEYFPFFRQVINK